MIFLGSAEPLTTIAQIIGYKTATTTARNYDSATVPPVLVIPLKLHHADDTALEPLPEERCST